MNCKRLSIAGITATMLAALFLLPATSVSTAQAVVTTAATTTAQNEVQRITVTNATIAALPPGKSYIMKLGSRRLTIQSANSDSSSTKQGQGDVILSGNNATGSASADSFYGSGVYKVYEFLSDARHPIDFSRVVVQEGENTNYVKLEDWLRKHRPARGMRGWPFKRLLVGPGKGIAEIEGWKTKDVQPGTDYHCEDASDSTGPDGFCNCTGIIDCAVLVIAGHCTGDLTCGDGECFCETN